MKLWLFVLQIFSRKSARDVPYCRRENQYLPECPLGRRIGECPLRGDCMAAESVRNR